MPANRQCRKFLSRWLPLVVIAGGICNTQAAPSIEITNVPAFGSFDLLGGRVLNASPSDYRVAVFIFIPSVGWWSKPYCDPALTVIQPDSSWTTDITTGGVDEDATRITALLVSTNYNEPCVEGPEVLPANVLTQAVASATVVRSDRWLSFSGYDWSVKTAPGLLGPGPNFFSDSTNNVWLDAQGQLHLRITNRSNQWQCAEVATARTFGYGSYRFTLASDVNSLNLNAVLGLFTYGEDPAYAHREIDIECSRWSNPYDIDSAQYVVQPWDSPGHLVRYAVPGGLATSTHLFTWETNRVSYQSQRGSYSPNPTPASVITNWVYTLDTPQTGDEVVHINLWLFNGNPPTGNNEVEFVIQSFQFVPLGSPQPATLTNLFRLPSSAVHLTVNGQPDRRYLVQSSSNLLDWQDLATLLVTNTVAEFLDTNAPAKQQRFYRGLTLP